MASGKKPPADTVRNSPQRTETPTLGNDRTMGTALRSVYQQTVDESIPDDLLELLGKLS